MAPSTAANFWLRVPSSESIAPALIRLSIMRRLTLPRSTFSQNWCSDVKRPTSSRALPMASTADWPEVLHRAHAEADGLAIGREAPFAVRSRPGGRTVMPISRHSLMYLTTLAVLPVSEVSSAAMKSTG